MFADYVLAEPFVILKAWRAFLKAVSKIKELFLLQKPERKCQLQAEQLGGESQHLGTGGGRDGAPIARIGDAQNLQPSESCCWGVCTAAFATSEYILNFLLNCADN